MFTTKRMPWIPFGLLLLGGSVRAQYQDPPAVPCGEPSPTFLCYGDHASCDIGFIADIDQYRFLGEAGDVVRIVLSGASVCLDPKIDLRDPSNQQMLLSSCVVDCGHACTFAKEVALPSDGIYTMNISDDGLTEVGSYYVHLEKVLPEYPAESLAYGAPPVVLTVDHPGDFDWVTFEGEQGSEVLLSAVGLNVCVDPHVQVFDPLGNLIQEKSCTVDCGHSCPLTIHWDPTTIGTLPRTGTYTVLVYDDGNSETGSIALSVACLFSPSGNCPDAHVDQPIGTTYCTSKMHSQGGPCTLAGLGTTSLTENRVFLYGLNAPVDEFGMFFSGMNQAAGIPLPPPSEGLLCVGNPFWRLGIIHSCATAEFFFRPDFGDLPSGMVVQPGETWSFQLWFRDAQVSNTSDGLAITFTP